MTSTMIDPKKGKGFFKTMLIVLFTISIPLIAYIFHRYRKEYSKEAIENKIILKPSKNTKEVDQNREEFQEDYKIADDVLVDYASDVDDDNTDDQNTMSQGNLALEVGVGIALAAAPSILSSKCGWVCAHASADRRTGAVGSSRALGHPSF